MYGRDAFQHKLMQVAPHAFGEVYVLSQIMGVCHVPSGFFYNQVSHRKLEELEVWGEIDCHVRNILYHVINENRSPLVILAKMARSSVHWRKLRIAGRGLLLDFGRYAKAHDLRVSYFDYYKISYPTLVAVAASQGINLKPES
ncbi:uncharacterized protein Z519_05000 [Cladophialophora bantiana CBS 173.52]|uniref:Uncharacterized protein n=1 Tax=Cladophialophora bantiana (strain ATCC 10958 / CBS 173.52 / CDC B-1940 / NIH 8579) TaxID=1442370 RepID=A0A0D2HVS6_CLAB1|nr:uncharacterized protein Z519_05000 [Cladophialophora bantiana CBS 173.52]KIW95020.1 hypothetical protein Z519_05000 [Cladophialophora bantiana CBS 173.52]